ncbi:MAG: hypothetical protein Q4G35_01560 [Propionibacteriaceae bacterium]|nr:hypothetical protein [Propionibacteriaceae bacterium]
MPEAKDLPEIARVIAEQAEKLVRARSVLREHPEQVAEVEIVDPLVRMLSLLDHLIDAAQDAFAAPEQPSRGPIYRP